MDDRGGAKSKTKGALEGAKEKFAATTTTTMRTTTKKSGSRAASLELALVLVAQPEELWQ